MPRTPAATPRARTTRPTSTRASKKSRDTIEISHPERIVFPDRGGTKQDVADYYDAVMAWLLPEIVERPLSIIRCPQGTADTCFFQKHRVPGMKHIDHVPLEEESGEVEDYLVVRDELAVRELVQFNAIEFHPWGAKAGTPDRADRIVFDLDPDPGVAWRAVVDAARQVRRTLADLDLQSFVRTSGGKGLHVVVPLKPAIAWERVRTFARGIADDMAQADPDRFVATASKKLREGRIFIDYLRNGRGATSVASFSLRARPGAPVAMPLRWEELGKVAAGNAFDIDTARARLRRLKQHPWGNFDDIKQKLPTKR